MSRVRLSEKAIKAIKKCTFRIFGSNSKVYLFGSRTDLDRKGGDIDLLVVTPYKLGNNWSDKKRRLLAEIKVRLGDRKIDLLVYDGENIDFPPTLELIRYAIETGVEL